MTVAVNTLANLKAVDTSSGKKLRFLEEKKAWYWYSPSGSETADDENVIQPNTGSGRWYKTEPKLTNNGLIYATYNGTQSISAVGNRGYICSSSTGAITITLPASPLPGDVVKVIHNSTGLSNVTQVLRNGKPIQGITAFTGIEIFQQYTEIDFTYCDSTVGWLYSTSKAVRVITTYSQTFTYSSGGDTNGLFYWLGTNQGAASFVNPTSSNLAVGAKMFVYDGAGADITTLTDRTTTGTTLTDNTSNIGRAGLSYFLIINRETSTRDFRLNQLLLRNTTTATHAWRSFIVEGIKAADIPISDIATNRPAGISRLGASLNWKPLAEFVNDTTMAATASAYALYTINSTDYYSGFRLRCAGLDASGSTTIGFNLGEVEFYGEVRS